MRTSAAHWLEMAARVHDYRRDRLTPAELGELNQMTEGLRRQLRDGDDASKLKLGIESLEDVLRRTGGAVYPKSSLVENVEFFLVAAIVILGIRTYFVQPFKIPTNSMWPSYNGMTGEVFKSTAEEPGYVAQGFRFIAQLAVAHRIDAPADGEVLIRFDTGNRTAHHQLVDGKKWWLIPTQLRQYQLVVGGVQIPIKVPADFDLDKVLQSAFFSETDGYPAGRTTNGGQLGLLRTGKTVKKGDRVLSFDILTGDQLFVDRVSYHFVKPKVGQGFVFRTAHISAIGSDQYYIKRLVGTPGDSIEIMEPRIYRNGRAIEGSSAFEKNATKSEGYRGYFNGQRSFQYPNSILMEGQKVTVPPDSYLALGDNSGNSLDSRYWGFIPDKDVVGKPLFIYYPFTTRWGPAP